jgi:hypothetical protein
MGLAGAAQCSRAEAASACHAQVTSCRLAYSRGNLRARHDKVLLRVLEGPEPGRKTVGTRIPTFHLGMRELRFLPEQKFALVTRSAAERRAECVDVTRPVWPIGTRSYFLGMRRAEIKPLCWRTAMGRVPAKPASALRADLTT